MATQNYDFDAERTRIERKKKIAEGLQLQGMQPLQGNNIHWTSAVAQILNTLAGIKGQKNADQESQALGQRYKDELAQGMEAYADTSQGMPAAPTPRIDETGAPVMRPAEPGNPRQAALDALASNHPMLQQLGMQQLTQAKKEGLTKKDLLSLSGFDPKSRIAAAMAGDESLLAPETKEHVVGQQIVAGIPGQGNYKPVGDFREKYSPVGQLAVGPDGRPIFGQTDTATGKASFAPAGTSVNVDTGQKAGVEFGKQLAGARAKAIETSFEKAQAASASLAALDAAQQDFQAGIKSGAPAQVALGFAKWAKALGFDADPSVANTEAFRSNMAQQVLSSVKALGAGTGISNADRDYAEKAAGGSIALDDQTMYRLMNIQKAAATNTLLSHNELLKRNAGASGAIPEDLMAFDVPVNVKLGDALDYDEATRRVKVKAPGAAAPKPGTASSKPIPGGKPSAGVMTLEDYLKSKGM